MSTARHLTKSMNPRGLNFKSSVPFSKASLAEHAPAHNDDAHSALRSDTTGGSPDGDQVVSDAPPPAPTYAAASRSSAS